MRVGKARAGWYNRLMENVRILLADDHAVVRAGICNALNEIPGLEVVGEAGDGPGVLETLSRLEPDFLIIDVSMPDFEPISAIHYIRGVYPEMKILVISAYDDDVYVQGLLGAGVHGYHLKDQPLSDLQLAVQRILVGQKWVSSRLVTKLVSYSESPPVTHMLTSRQRDILRLLQRGRDNQAIAREMGLSVKTIENHLTRLYRQLDVQSRLEAVNYANQHPEVLAISGQEAVQQTVHLAPASSPATAKIAILLVDDNARFRHQLRRMVGKVCPQAMIFEAENIDSAVNTAQYAHPQLALVDVVLGEESGIHCTKRLKAISPTSRVVLISAYPDREFHRSGLEAGALAFLDKKDLDAAVLRQVIDDLVV